MGAAILEGIRTEQKHDFLAKKKEQTYRSKGKYSWERFLLNVEGKRKILVIEKGLLLTLWEK